MQVRARPAERPEATESAERSGHARAGPPAAGIRVSFSLFSRVSQPYFSALFSRLARQRELKHLRPRPQGPSLMVGSRIVHQGSTSTCKNVSTDPPSNVRKVAPFCLLTAEKFMARVSQYTFLSCRSHSARPVCCFKATYSTMGHAPPEASVKEKKYIRRRLITCGAKRPEPKAPFESISHISRSNTTH